MKMEGTEDVRAGGWREGRPPLRQQAVLTLQKKVPAPTWPLQLKPCAEAAGPATLFVGTMGASDDRYT